MYEKIKILIFKIFQILLKILPSKISCELNNLRQKLMGRDITFSYERKLDLYKVKSDMMTMYFNEKMRGFNTYAYGIRSRAISLGDTYSLNKIKFTTNDIIIDCGANYGDIYIWSKINNIKINYISFEPSPEEFKCIKLNCENQNNNNLALSNNIGEFEFYLKSESGDSSLIKPAGGYNNRINVKTITLDNFLKSLKIEKIKFFKVEAEGFEPEILNGSINSLKKIEFIGVDGSPERGEKKEWTIDFAIDFLGKNGFELISLKKSATYAKGLFKNKVKL